MVVEMRRQLRWPNFLNPSLMVRLSLIESTIEQEGSMRLSINKNTSLFVLWFLYEVGGGRREGGSLIEDG